MSAITNSAVAAPTSFIPPQAVEGELVNNTAHPATPAADEKVDDDEKVGEEETDGYSAGGSDPAKGATGAAGAAAAGGAGGLTVLSEEERYLKGLKLVVVHSSLLLAIFLVALDQTIVATAIPRIVSQFDALSQVSWIASAYFLTCAGFILFYGQLVSIYPSKYVFLGTITLFEIGSLICAVAKSMNVLIFGRAFAGVGAGGLYGTVLAIIAEIAPLELRPALLGSLGAVFGLSSVLGPLLGGVFTDHVTWRWCFYINLPIGGLAAIVVLFVVKAGYSPLNDPTLQERSVFARTIRMDFVGTTLVIGTVTALLLPLQWGGNTKAWDDPVVDALFGVFVALLILFITWEAFLTYKRKDSYPLLPLQIFSSRTLVGACSGTFWVFLSMLLGIYELPLLYQAKGTSATRAGIDILPFMMFTVAGVMATGIVITKTGRYWWYLFLSPLIATIGCGLCFSITGETSNAKVIGYQIIFGFGCGGALQNYFLAVQAEYESQPSLIPITQSLVSFFQLVGGVIGVAIAGTIFANRLVTELAHRIPNLSQQDYEAVRSSVSAIFSLPVAEQGPVIDAYTRAIAYTFLLPIPATVLASLSALLIRDHNLKDMNITPSAAV